MAWTVVHEQFSEEHGLIGLTLVQLRLQLLVFFVLSKEKHVCFRELLFASTIVRLELLDLQLKFLILQNFLEPAFLGRFFVLVESIDNQC